MRYAKGGLVINPERDIPLLRQVRNSRFVSHNQLFELMKFGGSDRSRDSFNWRVRRLLKSGHVSVCAGVFCAGSSVYRISKEGLVLLEHHGQFTTVLHSNTEHLPHASQVFHALELNAIQIALAHKNQLASWQSEVEIASFNTISRSPYEKDYDAIVDVWVGDNRARFALEYERTLKSSKQYERVWAALQAERQVACILYLTSRWNQCPTSWHLLMPRILRRHFLKPGSLSAGTHLGPDSGSSFNDGSIDRLNIAFALARRCRFLAVFSPSARRRYALFGESITWVCSSTCVLTPP